MKKLLLTFYFAFYIFYSGFSQYPLVKEWDKRFGGTWQDWLRSINQTSDNGFLLAGWSFSDSSGDKTQNNWDSTMHTCDYWIIKIDSLGNKQWDKRYGGTKGDWLWSSCATIDGGYILGGTSDSDSSGDKSQPNWDSTYTDYWIIKVDSFGNKQWDKRYGGYSSEWLYSIQQTWDYGYILIGSSNSDSSGDKTQPSWGYDDYWIVKTDSLGNIQWDKDLGGTGGEFPRTLWQTADRGYILGGESSSGISGDRTQNNWDSTGYTADYWIIKIDSLGNKEWDRRFGGSKTEYLFNIKRTIDGYYLLGGISQSDSSGDKTQNAWYNGVNPTLDYWIVKIDSIGNKLWDKRFGGIAHEDEFGNIIASSDGGFIICGTSYSSASGDKTENNLGQEQMWIVKIDSAGNKLWDKTIKTLGHDEQCLGITLNDDCYIFATYTNGGIGGYKTQPNWDPVFNTYDYWIIKFCDSTATAINNIQSSTINFQIFPNPANDFINISLTSAEEKNVSVEIFDLLGREVLKRKLQTSPDGYRDQTKINISDFENGVYIVQVSTKNNFHKKKIVKM
ncbi:MAG TPA: T9SS type A sorting domain-containing protein [Bacteroidia bacterium]|nr:T9SS type A sorting domain-containing protein [Bacteroidia bacterium]